MPDQLTEQFEIPVTDEESYQHTSEFVDNEGNILVDINYICANKTDVDVIGPLTAEVLQRIEDSVDGNLGQLPANQRAGFENLYESWKKWCSEPGAPIPVQTYTSLIHNLYFNLRGQFNEDWFDKNPLPQNN